MPLGVDDDTVCMATACSHRLSVQTTVVSGTVWPQFTMHVLTGGCEHLIWGRSGRKGLEIGVC